MSMTYDQARAVTLCTLDTLVFRDLLTDDGLAIAHAYTADAARDADLSPAIRDRAAWLRDQASAEMTMRDIAAPARPL